jgi:PAS domain S-box-containing protein
LWQVFFTQERAVELEYINAELQQAINLLAESEQRYRTLFELSSEGICRWELEQPIPVTLPIDEQVDRYYRFGYIAEANAAFSTMYGYEKPEDLIGLQLLSFHVADSQTNKSMMHAFVEKGHRIRSAETEEVDSNGRRCYFLNNIVSTIKEGSVVGGWGTQVDITLAKLAYQYLYNTSRL